MRMVLGSVGMLSRADSNADPLLLVEGTGDLGAGFVCEKRDNNTGMVLPRFWSSSEALAAVGAIETLAVLTGGMCGSPKAASAAVSNGDGCMQAGCGC